MDDKYYIIRNSGTQGPLEKREVIQLIMDKAIGENHMIRIDNEVPKKAIDYLVFREYFEQEMELQDIELPPAPNKQKDKPEIVVKGRKNRGEVDADGKVKRKPKKDLDYEKLGLYALIGGVSIFFLVLIFMLVSSSMGRGRTDGSKAEKEKAKTEAPVDKKTTDKKPEDKKSDGGRSLPKLEDYAE